MAARLGWAALTLLTALAVAGAPAYANPTPDAAELDRRAAETAAQLGVVVEQYNTIQENLRATEGQLATVDAALAPVAARLAELRARVGSIASGVYVTSGLGPVDALLSSDSANTLLEQLTMLDYVTRQHNRDIAALQLTTQQYDTQRRTLEALARQQQAQQRELAARKATIEASLAELRALRARAPGAPNRPTRTEPRDPYVPDFSPDAAGVVLRFAYKQLGKWYRWGGEGPDGYDCSGLVLASWRAAGVRLPHSSSLQWAAVAHISRNELRPADLVFYYHDIHHVAIYVGAGRVIHAPEAGRQVSVQSIDRGPIYGYGRVRR